MDQLAEGYTIERNASWQPGVSRNTLVWDESHFAYSYFDNLLQYV